MFACNGILFNHESPRRGETFVTRKVRHIWGVLLVGHTFNPCLAALQFLKASCALWRQYLVYLGSHLPRLHNRFQPPQHA